MKTILPFALIAIFLLLTISSIFNLSGTCDELGHHIAGGYVILTQGDFKIDTSHPPLARYLIALPLKLFLKVHLPDKKEWRRAERTEFSRDFFYKYNHQPLKMLFLARSSIIVVGVVCAWILFLWSRQMYGAQVGILSLFFYVFSPVILAHGSLATIDMVATCFILLSLYSLWSYFRNPGLLHIFFAGACLGLAQLSKYSALILYPVFILLLITEIYADKKEGKRLILGLSAIFLLSLVFLWSGYGFELQPILKDAMRQQEKIEIAHHIIKNILYSADADLLSRLDNFLLNTPLPLASHILGILGLLRYGHQEHHIYFLGKWLMQGTPFYFWVAFILKNPIPFLISFCLGIITLFRKKLGREEWFLIIPAFLILIAASFSKLQLGIRYILPFFPLAFILAAKGATFFKNKPLKVIFAALLAWQVSSVVMVFPDYLSYFNEFAGGSKNSYKYLRDSDVDWGQDLPALAIYLRRNRIEEVTLEYFGQAEPRLYGINACGFSESEYTIPQSKVYAISAHYLEHVGWAKDMSPTERAGYSIFIYDFRKRIP